MAHVFDIRTLADEINIAKDKALGIALPPYFHVNRQRIEDNRSFGVLREQDATALSIFGTPMCFPLEIKTKTNSEWWKLPVEPIITVQGKMLLIRRNVSKISSNLNRRRGSMKEYWAEDDFTVTIDGLFTKKDDWSYPNNDVKALLDILESREAIDVKCPLFHWLGITRIVVEDFSFPFTKGEENQAYSIKAYSDDPWDLFIKLD